MIEPSNSTSPNSGPPGEYELAITGDAFQWMLDFASDEVFERVILFDECAFNILIDAHEVSDICANVT